MDIIEPKDIPKEEKAEPQKKKLIETNWGIACTSGTGNVYINKHLKAYNPILYKQIIKHEMAHDLGAYNATDLQEDINVDFLTLTEKVKFCLKHPGGWLFLSPIIVTKDEIMISWLGLFKLGIELAVLLFIIFYAIPTWVM